MNFSGNEFYSDREACESKLNLGVGKITSSSLGRDF